MWEYWSSSLRSPECALPPFPSIKPSLSATTPPIYGHPTKEKLCTQNACLPSKCALVVVILQERSTVGRQHRANKEGAERRPQSASQSFDKKDLSSSAQSFNHWKTLTWKSAVVTSHCCFNFSATFCCPASFYWHLICFSAPFSSFSVMSFLHHLLFIWVSCCWFLFKLEMVLAPIVSMPQVSLAPEQRENTAVNLYEPRRMLAKLSFTPWCLRAALLLKWRMQ